MGAKGQIFLTKVELNTLSIPLAECGLDLGTCFQTLKDGKG